MYETLPWVLSFHEKRIIYLSYLHMFKSDFINTPSRVAFDLMKLAASVYVVKLPKNKNINISFNHDTYKLMNHKK